MRAGLGADAFHHDNMLDRRRVGKRFVGIFFKRHDGAAPITAVGGDEHFGLSVVNPATQRLRR